MKYEKDVAKKTPAYWDSARAMPLELEEVNDYRVKDSSFRADTAKYNTKAYQDSISKRFSRVKLKHIFLGGMYKNFATKKGRFVFSTEGMVSLTAISYNPAEQVVGNFNSKFQFFNRLKARTITLMPKLRFGFGNGHFNPSVYFEYVKRKRDSSFNPPRRFTFYGGFGKRITEFNRDARFMELFNSLSTLQRGNNYFKFYENNFVEAGVRRKLENGISFNVNAMYEDRIPVDNTSDYTFRRSKFSKNITANYPIEQLTSQFERHQVLIFNASIKIKPGQQYIQFPNSKVSIGSKYPEFELRYSKAISGIFGSDANFDKWRFNVSDDKNLKLLGSFSYRLGVGGFLNRKKVFIQDYQHFTGNQVFAASPYLNSFQLAPYYAQSNTEAFFTYGHVEHHFNGLLTNKIPLFRKLNWNLVTGANAFYVNKNNNYVEAFLGLENIFKALRLDGVIGYRGNSVTTGLRLGAGGLIGGAFKFDSDNSDISIGF
jgi:hypothetical protein